MSEPIVLESDSADILTSFDMNALHDISSDSEDEDVADVKLDHLEYVEPKKKRDFSKYRGETDPSKPDHSPLWHAAVMLQRRFRYRKWRRTVQLMMAKGEGIGPLSFKSALTSAAHAKSRHDRIYSPTYRPLYLWQPQVLRMFYHLYGFASTLKIVSLFILQFVFYFLLFCLPLTVVSVQTVLYVDENGAIDFDMVAAWLALFSGVLGIVWGLKQALQHAVRLGFQQDFEDRITRVCSKFRNYVTLTEIAELRAEARNVEEMLSGKLAAIMFKFFMVVTGIAVLYVMHWQFGLLFTGYMIALAFAGYILQRMNIVNVKVHSTFNIQRDHLWAYLGVGSVRGRQHQILNLERQSVDDEYRFRVKETAVRTFLMLVVLTAPAFLVVVGGALFADDTIERYQLVFAMFYSLLVLVCLYMINQERDEIIRELPDSIKLYTFLQQTDRLYVDCRKVKSQARSRKMSVLSRDEAMSAPLRDFSASTDSVLGTDTAANRTRDTWLFVPAVVFILLVFSGIIWAGATSPDMLQCNDVVLTCNTVPAMDFGDGESLSFLQSQEFSFVTGCTFTRSRSELLDACSDLLEEHPYFISNYTGPSYTAKVQVDSWGDTELAYQQEYFQNATVLTLSQGFSEFGDQSGADYVQFLTEGEDSDRQVSSKFTTKNFNRRLTRFVLGLISRIQSRSVRRSCARECRNQFSDFRLRSSCRRGCSMRTYRCNTIRDPSSRDACNAGFFTRHPDIVLDGGISRFTKWTPCDANFLQFRFRSCTAPPPTNGGADCPPFDAQEVRTCDGYGYGY